MTNLCKELLYRRFSDVQPEPVRWLWPERIAKGKLTIIAGDPGLGKSQLTCSVAAIVSRGASWPVGGGRTDPATVVVFSAEDDPADTIRPRLDAANADPDRVVILEGIRELGRAGESSRLFNVQEDLQVLEDNLRKITDVSLIIIDPITAYLGKADSHKNAEVRSILATLAALAARLDVAVICVTHLNKGTKSQALMRVNGSLGFVAAARAVFFVTQSAADPERRFFLPLKLNNANLRNQGLAFSIEGVTLSGGIETARVAWEDETVEIDVNEALWAVSDGDTRNALAEAGEFLSEILADGPVEANDVRQHAQKAGHSWATVRRASKALSVKKFKVGFGGDGGWLWQIPPKELKRTNDAQGLRVSRIGKVEHLWTRNIRRSPDGS